MKYDIRRGETYCRLVHIPENKADENKLIAMIKELSRAGHNAIVEYRNRQLSAVLVQLDQQYEPEPEKPVAERPKLRRNPAWEEAKYAGYEYKYTEFFSEPAKPEADPLVFKPIELKAIQDEYGKYVQPYPRKAFRREGKKIEPLQLSSPAMQGYAKEMQEALQRDIQKMLGLDPDRPVRALNEDGLPFNPMDYHGEWQWVAGQSTPVRVPKPEDPIGF